MKSVQYSQASQHPGLLESGIADEGDIFFVAQAGKTRRPNSVPRAEIIPTRVTKDDGERIHYSGEGIEGTYCFRDGLVTTALLLKKATLELYCSPHALNVIRRQMDQED